MDFGDSNNLANNYTGTGVEYGPAAKGASLDAEQNAVELIVDLGDGSVAMAGGPVGLNGYSVSSAGGSLLPDDFPMPRPLHFYLSNTAGEITAGTLGTPVLLDGELALPWGLDAGGLAGATSGRGFVAEGDLIFTYGTAAGTFDGQVVYLPVPEPGTLAMFVGAALGLLLLSIRRRAA